MNIDDSRGGSLHVFMFSIEVMDAMRLSPIPRYEYSNTAQ